MSVQSIEELERKYVIKPGAQDMAMRLQERGGETTIAGDPASIAEFIRGGMVKELLEGLAFLENVGKMVGPNIALAGGQADPGDSATASSILAGNAAVVMGDWKKAISAGRTKVLRRVAALLLQGEDRREYAMPVAPGRSIPLVWDASTRDISYDQYRYTIKPSSNTAGMDPRAKLRSLFEVLSALPSLLQLVIGTGNDPQKALQVIEDLAGLPELGEMFPTGDMAQIQMQMFQMLAQGGKAMPQGMGGGGPGMLAQAGPATSVGQMNSDRARAIPA